MLRPYPALIKGSRQCWFEQNDCGSPAHQEELEIFRAAWSIEIQARPLFAICQAMLKLGQTGGRCCRQLAKAFYKQLIAEDNQGVATFMARIGLPMCQDRDVVEKEHTPRLLWFLYQPSA